MISKHIISRRVSVIKPSATLSLSAKIRGMQSRGIDVISFAAGEPDFETPQNIKQAAIKAIQNGNTRYTPTSGVPELKQAICKAFVRDDTLHYTPDQVLVGAGAKQCLFNLIQTLINSGDEVIIPVPYWVSFVEMVRFAGGKSVFLKTKNGAVPVRILEHTISKRTKLLILNSPSNPTGYMFSRRELADIARICVRAGISVISDETYDRITYGKKHISIAAVNKKIFLQTFVVKSLSKTYAIPGWRVGYCAGDASVISAASSLQDHSTSNTNSIAQQAALAALAAPRAPIKSAVKIYKKKRDLMMAELKKIKGISFSIPDGAFYIFVRVSALYGKNIHSSTNFCDTLLAEAKIAAVPGIAFGDDRSIRLSFATSTDNIKKGMARLRKILSTV